MKRLISVSAEVHAGFLDVSELLVDDAAAVLGLCDRRAERGARRFSSLMPVSPGTGLQQPVVIDVAMPRVEVNAVFVPLAWQATGPRHLLPGFTGELRATPGDSGTSLELRGTYVVPLRGIGRFGDSVAGHQLASRSLAAFLDQVRARMDAEIERRSYAERARRAS